jgi:probable HAF family extracellular repeat protein
MRTKNVAPLIAIIVLAGPLAAAAQQYTVTALGTLGGTSSYGYGINASGQVTGYSDTTGNAATHAFLYSNGTMHDLGTLGGTTGSYGYGINESGQVTGYSWTTGNLNFHAFLYSDGTMHDLGTLGGAISYGFGINTSGQITGWSYTAGDLFHAFLYSNGEMTDLNSLISRRNAALYSLNFGQAINYKGQIVVNATVNATGQGVALLLTPTK